MTRLNMKLVLCAATFLVLTGSAKGARPAFRVQPAPAWAAAAPIDTGASVADDAAGGIFYLLEDHQQRVSGNSTERYYHEAYRVISQAGLDAGSQVQPEFDPTYEELIFHGISIRRGDRTIDALKPREIKLIQPETSLDEQEYNGLVSALVFLNDVRVGDVVDYSYSVNGSNPVMRGRFAARIFLIGNHPIRLLRRRLLWASDRTLQYNSLNTDLKPVINEIGSLREYTWRRENVIPMQVDDRTPAWFDPYPGVQLTDFISWEDVTSWALPLYNTNLSIAPELARQILMWKAASARPEEQILAALRFVQDEVRYLAIEIGPNSNRPNPPSVVFKRRYGDCKDKSLLLTTVLNELGIEAHPALVNTQGPNRLNLFRPSPFAFDHCIVRAMCAGKTLWLDPTISLQRGTLENLSGADEGLALVLKAGARELEPIPETPNDRVLESVNEIYTVESYTSPASFEVTTTFRNADADSRRYSLTSRPISDVARDYLNYYAHTDASISADGIPSVTDDPVSNTLVIAERYRIPDFWSGGGRDVFADRINQELGRPSITQRNMPLAIPYPVYVEQSIEIRLPDMPSISAASGTLSDEATYFDYKIDVSPGNVRIRYVYRTLKNHLEATSVASHLELIAKISSALSRRVSRGYASSQPQEISDAAIAITIGVLAAPFVIIAVVLWARRGKRIRRVRLLRRGLKVVEGQGPENPVTIASEEGLGQMLKSLRCRCGAAYPLEESPPSQQRLIYDGRRLIAVTITCSICGAPRDAYFAPLNLS